MRTVLLTGVAGFIAFHYCKKLMQEGYRVIGVDSLDNYYDVELKRNRIKELQNLNKTHFNDNSFLFMKKDLSVRNDVEEIFINAKYDFIVHLAAQAGVRHSIENPYKYVSSNIDAFLNILELARQNMPMNFVYASTSSAYGASDLLPFSEHDPVSHPLQFYAVTKRFNELAAHSYSSLYNIPATGLRFFTVYGPWGRPDMALFIFTKSIIEGNPIDVFNFGNHLRDFTYVDDIVEGIFLAMINIPLSKSNWKYSENNSGVSYCPFEIYNIGNEKGVKLIDFINEIELNLGIKAKINFLPMQQGDVPDTLSNISKLKKLGYKPKTSYKEGIAKFINWYRDYYNV